MYIISQYEKNPYTSNEVMNNVNTFPRIDD